MKFLEWLGVVVLALVAAFGFWVIFSVLNSCSKQPPPKAACSIPDASAIDPSVAAAQSVVDTIEIKETNGE